MIEKEGKLIRICNGLDRDGDIAEYIIVYTDSDGEHTALVLDASD